MGEKEKLELIENARKQFEQDIFTVTGIKIDVDIYIHNSRFDPARTNRALARAALSLGWLAHWHKLHGWVKSASITTCTSVHFDHHRLSGDRS